MAKFNNFKAFTGGVDEGLNNANARRDQERLEFDKLNQEKMLRVDADNEIAKAKEDRDTTRHTAIANAFKAQVDKVRQDRLGGSTLSALNAASSTGDANGASTPVSDATTSAAPAQPTTGMPAGGSIPNTQPPQASDAPAPTQSTALPAQGGLHSPLNSPVPINGLASQQTPSQTQAPSQVPSTSATVNTQDTNAAVTPMKKADFSPEEAPIFDKGVNDYAEKIKGIDALPDNAGSAAYGAGLLEVMKYNIQKAGLVQKEAKGPINIQTDLTSDETKRFTAIFPDSNDLAKVKLHEPTRTEETLKQAASTRAENVETGTSTFLNSLARQSNLLGNYTSGYGSGTIANISNTITSWAGLPQDEKSKNTQELAKNINDALISTMQSMPAGVRQGFKMSQQELAGLTSLTNGEIPNRQILNSLMGKALAANQAAYLQRTQGHYETQDYTNLLVEKYRQNNPVFMPDGETPNPKWMSADDWVEAGGPKSDITQSSVASSIRNSTNNDRVSAEKAASGAPKNDPMGLFN